MKENTVRKGILALVIPAVVLAVWHWATTYRDIPTGILPTLTMVKQAFFEMIQTGELQNDLLISLQRVIKGFLVSALFGVFLGSIVGMFGTVRELLAPAITVIRQIPIIAWIPLIIM